MLKIVVLLFVLAAVGFFLRELVEALFIATLIVFAVFIFVGLVFTFRGLSTGDTAELLTGMSLVVFSAAYLLVSYLKVREKKRET